jgi:hypothetical protein
MYAQRLGALPPYNELLGSKLAAMSLVSERIRDDYETKYRERVTEMRGESIPANLLFITTTSAYGKSSVYERIRYKERKLGRNIGATAGSGTFHISDSLYRKLLNFLESKGVDTRRGYGTGPSRKRSLLHMAFRLLGIESMTYHNISRAFYIFELVCNLQDVIQNNDTPLWNVETFQDISEYWKCRYCIPRAERTNRWKSFKFENFMGQSREEIQAA